MKKLLQRIYCYTEREVIDVKTGKKEIGTYYKIFGFVYKTNYRPAEKCDHSNFLGLV